MPANSGATGYAAHGEVDIAAGFLVGIDAIVGSSASAKLANTFSERRLTKAAGGFCFILGVIPTVRIAASPPCFERVCDLRLIVRSKGGALAPITDRRGAWSLR
jgi:hypothetical protein